MKEFWIKPLGEFIVIKPAVSNDMTKGGLIIPYAAKEKSNEGTVAAVGPGKYSVNGKIIPLSVKINDRVLYKRNGGTVDYCGW